MARHGRGRSTRSYGTLAHPLAVVDASARGRVRKLGGCWTALERAIRFCHAAASLRATQMIGIRSGSRSRACFGVVGTVWARIRADLAVPSRPSVADAQRARASLARPWTRSTGGGRC